LPQNRFLKGWALGQARRAQLPIPSWSVQDYQMNY
jgi:hypothetical protein